jgi:hypothetical protein
VSDIIWRISVGAFRGTVLDLRLVARMRRLADEACGWGGTQSASWTRQGRGQKQKMMVICRSTLSVPNNPTQHCHHPASNALVHRGIVVDFQHEDLRIYR